MLILTRMPGEQIRIGDDVVIAVMGAGEVQVSLGIDAPRSVPVVRAELLPQPLEATGNLGRLQPEVPDVRLHQSRRPFTGT